MRQWRNTSPSEPVVALGRLACFHLIRTGDNPRYERGRAFPFSSRLKTLSPTY
jgi:hypothetical protein